MAYILNGRTDSGKPPNKQKARESHRLWIEGDLSREETTLKGRADGKKVQKNSSAPIPCSTP